MHCVVFNQCALLCATPTEIETRGSSVKFFPKSVHRSLLRLRVFFEANFYSTVEVLPNFQDTQESFKWVSKWVVNLGIGFPKPLTLPLVKLDEKMNICSSIPQHGGYTNSSLLEGDVKGKKCHAMLFSRTCMSRKWMWLWPLASK